MILHHVAHGAGFVIEIAAPLDAEFFGDGDLHVFDETAAPQRLEQQYCRSAAPSDFAPAPLPR